MDYTRELPHSEISGSKVVWHLPEAYRSQTTSFIAVFSLGIRHAPLVELPVRSSANRLCASLRYARAFSVERQAFRKRRRRSVRCTLCAVRSLHFVKRCCLQCMSRTERPGRLRPIIKRDILSACRFQWYVIFKDRTQRQVKKPHERPIGVPITKRHLLARFLADNTTHTWAVL